MYKMPPRKSKTQNPSTISTTNISAEMESKVNTIKESAVLQQEVTPPVVESTQAVPLDNEVVTKNVESIETHFDNLYLTLTAFKQSISTMNNHLKLLERDMKKELRVLKKATTKQKNKGNRKPSGFAKPSDVSVELCNFMGREKGTQIARTEVTQYLISYIKENQLQFAENKKVILPDTKLKTLLGVDDKTQVTYFNLQGLMNKHFVR
jgi:chromatin remodeling complex protein RSC6